ncbi:MAG: hypothetical protein P8144_06635 [Gammaproteobacteria bacterium]
MELHALSIERGGDRAQALKLYQNLAETLEDGANKTRVTQRLTALASADQNTREKLRKTKYLTKKDPFSSQGFVAQNYLSLTNKTNDNSEKVLETLSTDYDLRTSYTQGTHVFFSRINGYSIADNLDKDDSYSRINWFSLNYKNESNDLQATLGRQRDRDNGAFYRFDGLTIQYPLASHTIIGFATGEPHYRSDIYDNVKIRFNSVYSTSRVNQNLKLNGYLNRQTIEGIVDRSAIGGSLRYRDKNINGIVNLDYDIEFNELNNLLISATYLLTPDSNISSIIGLQRSPFLTVKNVIIGQFDTDIATFLSEQENRENIYDTAEQKTAINHYYSLSYTNQIGGDIRMISDIYLSNTQDQRPANEIDTPLDFKYQSTGLQFVKSSDTKLDHTTTLGVRYTTSDTSNSASIFLGERLRFNQKLYVTPKISFFTIENKNTAVRQPRLRYHLLANYRPSRSVDLHGEIGQEKTEFRNVDIESSSTYFHIGYSYRF